jgi:hypothetical protein
VSRTFNLPDGRIVAASVFDLSGGDSPHLGPVWELSITPGEPTERCVGHPLNSALADLLGYRVAHGEWPDWIDELAAQIERAFGVPS